MNTDTDWKTLETVVFVRDESRTVDGNVYIGASVHSRTSQTVLELMFRNAKRDFLN